MSQRWMFAWTSTLSAACLAMVGFVWHGAQQSAEASRAMIASLQESNRQFIEQGRAFNALVLEKLNQPEHKGAPAVLPDATRLKFRVVQGSAEGPVAPGCRVGIQSQTPKDGRLPAMVYIDETGPAGLVDCGLLTPGPYDYYVFAPGALYTSQTFYLRVGEQEQVETVVCPVYDDDERQVAFAVDWPDDPQDQWKGWGLVCDYQPSYLTVAGRMWMPFENERVPIVGRLNEASFKLRCGRVLIFPDGHLLRLAEDLKFEGRKGVFTSATLQRVEKNISSTLLLRGTRHALRIRGLVPADGFPKDGQSEFDLKVLWINAVSHNGLDSVEFDLAHHELTKVPIKVSSEFVTRIRSAGLLSAERN